LPRKSAASLAVVPALLSRGHPGPPAELDALEQRAANGPKCSPSLGIAMSANMAYASLLIGPPLFGAIATVSSLRLAFSILLVVAVAIAALTFAHRAGGAQR
jgi:hypothetical protein